jgi:hypothetical protein
MKHNKHIIALAVATLLTAPVVYSAPPDWNQCTTPADPIACLQEQVRTLSDIQPGLGTVMIEYSNRYTDMYYAAKGGNWDFAAYQLKEALEIQEVGEMTRPNRAGALKYFENTYLTPVGDAIVAQDFSQFKTAFNQATEGCNSCHTGNGFGYIQYKLPSKAPTPALTRLPK